jgi:uncharacterized protein (DUF2384 family)
MKIITGKSSEIDIPEVLYDELFIFYKGDEAVISNWLRTPKPFLEDKAPIDLLDTQLGLESILDLINRLKTGDLS